MKSLILITLLLFSGCTTKSIYVDRPVEVYIPVEKQLVLPQRPVKGSNRAESLLNILKYTEKLEVIVGAK